MSYLEVETCTVVNKEDPDKSGWDVAPKWYPGKYFMHDYDVYYRRYYMVPITQQIRVPLRKKADGYYYYTETWLPFEEHSLKYPVFEIYETTNRSQIEISFIRVVRGSKMSTIWRDVYYRGPHRDLPSRFRNVEQIHFARLRKEAGSI